MKKSIMKNSVYTRMYDALCDYFRKIKSPDYFLLYTKYYNPKYVERVLHGEYIFERENELDFSFFKQNYGYEMPDILKAYYSFCHPCVIGSHYLNPHITEVITLDSSINPNCFKSLTDSAEYWKKYNILDIQKYIPIGGVSYNGSDVVLERDTGRIFVEYPFAEDPTDDKDGELFPTPLAEDLTSFIRELKPYKNEI